MLFTVFSSTAFCGENGHIIGGVYYDNLNHVNARLGYSYYLKKPQKDFALLDSPVLFGEIEAGEKGQKITLGYGYANYVAGMGGSYRVGLSAAELNNETFLGIESVASIFVVGFKLGAYRNIDTGENELLLGIGLGF